MSYQPLTNLQFKKLLKNSFQSIKLEVKDDTGEKIPFLSVGITQVARFWIISFDLYFMQKSCSKPANFPIFRGHAK